MMERNLFTPKEVILANGGVLPMSLSGLYKAIRDGIIPAVKLGKRIYIPRWYLESLGVPKGEQVVSYG